MLKIIPSRGPGITTKEITQILADEGFSVTKRQIERDLRQLQESFPLDCNDKGTPYGWRWIEGVSLNIPGVSLTESLSLHLIEKTIRSLLPQTVLKAIEPRLRQADSKLKSLSSNSTLARWSDKVRTFTPAMPLLPPEINPDVLDNIQSALLTEHKLEVNYLSLDSDTAKPLILNPLALVQRGEVTYLIATAYKYDDIRLYAIHRFTSASTQHEQAVRPIDFNLDKYLNSGFMQFGTGSNIKLEAFVDEWLVRILNETPLSDDQKITKNGDLFRVKATLSDSWQLHWWILSQGESIEIVKPVLLRHKIKNSLSSALSKY
jgi:predicted DNA-binding transcriptional regulator YafY